MFMLSCSLKTFCRENKKSLYGNSFYRKILIAWIQKIHYTAVVSVQKNVRWMLVFYNLVSVFDIKMFISMSEKQGNATLYWDKKTLCFVFSVLEG